ncbi:hypothetical protein BDP27DRAFT_804259 [Rhodocollybia butyracea]|uniref:Rap1 Myb domain-containing protein n=1 Tax=Rhodocollybia butyracea TaxID=206335 RepID=A0A9P5Q6X6_9AGAR|nr:hypothetical protein BDP27DRAFT_804259 [Rhodocollybia butyracea]
MPTNKKNNKTPVRSPRKSVSVALNQLSRYKLAYDREEDLLLAHFLNSQRPDGAGRTSRKLYEVLVEDKKRRPWAAQRTAVSWRERYKKLIKYEAPYWESLLDEVRRIAAVELRKPVQNVRGRENEDQPMLDPIDEAGTIIQADESLSDFSPSHLAARKSTSDNICLSESPPASGLIGVDFLAEDMPTVSASENELCLTHKTPTQSRSSSELTSSLSINIIGDSYHMASSLKHLLVRGPNAT